MKKKTVVGLIIALVLSMGCIAACGSIDNRSQSEKCVDAIEEKLSDISDEIKDLKDLWD